MRKLIAIASLAVAMGSCNQNVFFEENKSIPSAKWAEKESVNFEFEITDTLALHNFYINMRNDEGYPYSNIYLFADLEFPNGKKSVDTIECKLADVTGRWLGSGLGDIYDNRFLYKERKQFPMEGRYRLRLYQGMRTEQLSGIHDVGFRLELVQ